jgi:hypothetical protein
MMMADIVEPALAAAADGLAAEGMFDCGHAALERGRAARHIRHAQTGMTIVVTI